jgi:hypothetical protein
METTRTTNETNETRETAERAELVAGLRALADWLEARPGVPVDGRPGAAVSVWLVPGADEDVRARVGRIARAMGRADKRVVGALFELRREFPGRVRCELSMARERVCERVVVGEEQVEELDLDNAPRRTVTRERVEWRCPEALLGAGDSAAGDGDAAANLRDAPDRLAGETTPGRGRKEETTMQFLIETVSPATPANRGRQVALCATLADVRQVAEEFVGRDAPALAELGLGRSFEGELEGDFGRLRFAPAA